MSTEKLEWVKIDNQTEAEAVTKSGSQFMIGKDKGDGYLLYAQVASEGRNRKVESWVRATNMDELKAVAQTLAACSTLTAVKVTEYSVDFSRSDIKNLAYWLANASGARTRGGYELDEEDAEAMLCEKLAELQAKGRILSLNDFYRKPLSPL